MDGHTTDETHIQQAAHLKSFGELSASLQRANLQPSLTLLAITMVPGLGGLLKPVGEQQAHTFGVY
jgi:hypothetical protein